MTKVPDFAEEVTTIAWHLFPCLMSTEYVGQIPQEAKLEDVISIVAGAATPFLVRPTGDAFTLIGPCYVHGPMKSEALKKTGFPWEEPRLVRRSIPIP